MNGFPKPGESMREFLERPAKERRSALELKERQKAEGEVYRKWMMQQGIPVPLTKEERQERERKEYQEWLAEAERAARKRPG